MLGIKFSSAMCTGKLSLIYYCSSPIEHFVDFLLTDFLPAWVHVSSELDASFSMMAISLCEWPLTWGSSLLLNNDFGANLNPEQNDASWTSQSHYSYRVMQCHCRLGHRPLHFEMNGSPCESELLRAFSVIQFHELLALSELADVSVRHSAQSSHDHSPTSRVWIRPQKNHWETQVLRIKMNHSFTANLK